MSTINNHVCDDNHAFENPSDEEPVIFVGLHTEANEADPIVYPQINEVYSEYCKVDDYEKPSQLFGQESPSRGYIENCSPSRKRNLPESERESLVQENKLNKTNKILIKSKLTDSDREAYERNMKKYRLSNVDKIFIFVGSILLLLLLICLVVLRDKIWPVVTYSPQTSSPTMLSLSVSPSTPIPSSYPSISTQPTYTGYRDGTILNFLKPISPFLPSNGYDLDDSSPQNLAAKFVIYDDPLYIKPHQQQQIQQRYVLVSLFYSTGGHNWASSSLWLNETECYWEGITCSSDSIVTKISIQSNNLFGSIPQEISFFTNLTYLTLRNNFLNGSPLPLFVNMTLLKTLDLRYNRFHGKLLSSIGQMQSLQVLYLEGNHFSVRNLFKCKVLYSISDMMYNLY